jgi:hypothetical protein
MGLSAFTWWCSISAGAIAGIFAAYVVYKLRNRAFVGFTAEDQSYIAQASLHKGACVYEYDIHPACHC